MHHMSRRQGLRSFSASRRRTVSRDSSPCSVSVTISPASNCSVQRASPAGGLEQAVATSSASSLPLSLRSAPGRGSSLSAASRLPSTKRRLVRYTVEPLTPIVRAISSSPTPASAASRTCARLSLRAACLPPLSSLSSSPRSSWLSSTRYRTFIPISSRGRPDESNDESEIRHRATDRPASLHSKARPVPGLHLRLQAYVRSGPSRSRHATTLPRHPAFRPPDGPWARTRWPDPPTAGRRQKHRRPRSTSGSAYPRVAPDQPVKFSVTSY